MSVETVVNLCTMCKYAQFNSMYIILDLCINLDMAYNNVMRLPSNFQCLLVTMHSGFQSICCIMVTGHGMCNPVSRRTICIITTIAEGKITQNSCNMQTMTVIHCCTQENENCRKKIHASKAVVLQPDSKVGYETQNCKLKY